MAACDEVFAPCGKNLFCATDRSCRLGCEDLLDACKDPCDMLTYIVVLLSMVTVCLIILSIGLYLRGSSQRNIANVMGKYHVQNASHLEEVLKSFNGQMSEPRK
ncbi:uncharacterized protein LOC117328653 [Pecten maximus]|uniref:uncharacterized protein LOC117328653 n=1 Tax=Pecten maximus TaxID=6579 RepID=UPI001458DEA7|nr:uncharacterized protein LOC117328653 [Pecten maximus]